MMRAMTEEPAREQLWHCIYQVRHAGVLVRTCRQLEDYEADKEYELVSELINLVDELLGGQKGRKSLDDLLQEVEFSYSHLLKKDFPALEWDDRSVVHALLASLENAREVEGEGCGSGAFPESSGHDSKVFGWCRSGGRAWRVA